MAGVFSEKGDPIAFVKRTVGHAIRSKFEPHNKGKGFGRVFGLGMRKMSKAFSCTSFLPVLECT